ncbi:MAG: PIN domain-containing protein [Verrucomicrobiae bacterium]|nr:PIN domain-containing protein [Verrucomicrobiae bacterium]MCP5520898.1 PIN domain-containing protein [Verrucomicrobiales bacterium]
MSARIAYLDTSAILALLLPFDALHAAAGEAWDAAVGQVKPWTWLHALEVAQSLRNVAARRPAPAPRAALEQIARDALADVQRGLWQRVRLEPEDLPHRAELVGATHGGTSVIGAFDLLHIAGAQMTAADLFVTGDANQAKAARAAGLKVQLLRA